MNFRPHTSIRMDRFFRHTRSFQISKTAPCSMGHGPKQSNSWVFCLVEWFPQMTPIVGTQNLSLEVLTSKFYYNSSHNLNTNKQQGINTPQWETQAVDFFNHSCYNYNYRRCYRKLSCSYGDTLDVSLSFYFYYSSYIDFSSSSLRKSQSPYSTELSSYL